MRIPQEIVDKLNEIPLEKVMEMNGYFPLRKTDEKLFYCCPFHGESEASFKIDRRPSVKQRQGEIPLAGFHCFGCGKSGYGALMLQAFLMEKNLKQDFRLVADELSKIAGLVLEGDPRTQDLVNSLAKMENMVIDGDHKNSFFHRQREYAEPMDEICLIKKDNFSHSELRALGCQVQQVFRKNYSSEEKEENAVLDADNQPVYKYSFGKGYYNHAVQDCNFDPRLLIERFSLYPLSGFISEKRYKEHRGREVSYEVQATDTYPIFAFIYQDQKGWWAKKYEPLFKQTEGSNNYKFTWWYEGGKRRDEEFNLNMYGDVDVMRALAGEPVETSDEDHPTIETWIREDGERKRMKKFKKLIICSGPRDAINVYFHSEAHVCFPHSENVEIPDRIIRQLFQIAEEVYVLYDIDKTGRKKANRLAMRYLEIKVINLPNELKKLRSSRTGEPCKDAEEYFNYFPNELKKIRDFYEGDINAHFRTLINRAKPNMFWNGKPQIKNKNKDDEYTVMKYTLDVNNMNQFLTGQGMCVHKTGSRELFADIGEDNIVTMYDQADATLCAKLKMQSYLENSTKYYDPELSNMINDTRRLKLDNLRAIKDEGLDFHSWGEDFDYLFFENGAVKVTADEIRRVPYASLPYHVNRESILPDEFEKLNMERYFEIVPHPTMKAITKDFEARRYNAKNSKEKAEVLMNYKAKEKVWKYQLILHKPIEEMPPVFQFIYDLGRVFWREEESGMPLTEEKKQFQDAHFINKIIGLGYMLSRFRTPMRQQMVAITDYLQQQENVASGRNGKTQFASLLRLARKAPNNIPGQQFQRDAKGFAQNFASFIQTVHSYIYIDDLQMGTNAELFYNITSQITIKNLYQDTVTISPEESPKIMVTMNKWFDTKSSSTYGRLWPMLVSDYYHGESSAGDEELRNAATKFGYDIINTPFPEEAMFNRNLLAYALQLYFRFAKNEKGVIYPPIEKEGAIGVAAAEIKDPTFMNWANEFFSNPWHFGRPISRKEMAVSFLYYTGVDVTSSSVSRTISDISKKLKTYCEKLHIVINPPVIYKNEGTSDESTNIIRRVTWETVFMGDRPVSPRVRRKSDGSVSCWYFYREGTVPFTNREVHGAPDKDPEPYED